MNKSVVIAGYRRSPFHFATKGMLARVRPDDIITQVVKDLVETTKVAVDDIEDLILGCAFPEAEQGLNVARMVGLMSGLPQTVAGQTINRYCGSSMQAIHSAAGAIQMGAGEVFITGGIESMGRVPMGGFNPLPNPALYKMLPQAYIDMGTTAENLAKKFEIARVSQEEFSLRSHQKAVAALEAGHFKDELVPINYKDRVIDADGCIRPGSTLEKMATLKPAFDVSGTVTAATSSPLTDGAVAVLVASEDYAKSHNLEIMARIKSIAVAGCAPEIMGIGPVAATNKALSRAGLTLDDMDVIELNEAFASQSLAVIQELGINVERLNIDGGAIALGHPLGASGGRITAKAAQIMKREGKKHALATMCIGGGMGIATVLEAV